MLDRDATSREVVVRNAVTPVVSSGSVEDHQWNRSTKTGDGFELDARTCEEQSIDPQLEEPFDSFDLQLLLAIPCAEKHPIPELSCLELDSRDDIAEEGVGQIGNHDAHHAGAPLNQTPSHGVGSVVELGHGRENRSAIRGAHTGVAANHERHQRLGDPGPTGDVEDRGLLGLGGPAFFLGGGHLTSRRFAVNNWNVPLERSKEYQNSATMPSMTTFEIS